MAKRKIVVNEGKKKKRNGCCTCVLVVFIVFLVVLGAGVGVGWYFGDKYTKQYLDLSLKECFSVVRDLSRAREKNIVEKSYSGTSETAFEDQLKKQLFLNENADLNKDELIKQLLGKDNGGTQSELLGRVLRESGAELPNGDEDNSGSEQGGGNAIMNYVASLYTAENMDLVSLHEYDESRHENYILNFTDVQLAAFLADALKEGLNSEAVAGSGALKSIGDILGDVKLGDVLFLDQVVFYGTEQEPHMKLTMSVDVRTIANAYITDATGMKLGFVTKTFLPKRLFLTADIAMCEDGKLELFINEMNAEKMDRFYKLINGLSNEGGGENKDIRETINESAEKIVGGIAKAVKDYGNVSEISSGKLKIDLLQAVIEASKLNEGKDEEQALTSSDVIYALKYAVTSDFENAIQKEFTWKDRYYNIDDPSAPAVYKNAADVTDKDIAADYEEELLKELEAKYLIKRVDEHGNERSFADLMGLFGIGGTGDGTTVLDWIDSSRLGELAAKDGDIRLVITDEMLGAIFSAQIDALIGADGTIAQMQPQIYQVHIEENGGKYFMHAGIAVKVDGVLGNAGAIGDMISGIFGGDMMLSFVMEITPDVPADYVYAPTALALNDLTQDEMNRFINILSKFGVDFSVSGLASQIETPMRDALKNMKSQMAGLTFETSKICMPDVFSITVDKVLSSDGEPILYASEKGGEKDTPLIGNDLKGVVDSLYNYVGPLGNIPGGDLGFTDILKNQEITQEQLGQYIRLQMNVSPNFQIDKFTDLVRVDIVAADGREYVKFVVVVDKNNLFEEGNDGGDFNKFVNVDKVYAEITVDLKDTENVDGSARYLTSATINGMQDLRRRQFDAVVGKFNPAGAAQISFDDRAGEIGKMVYDLITAFKGVGGDIRVENGVIKRAA